MDGAGGGRVIVGSEHDMPVIVGRSRVGSQRKTRREGGMHGGDGICEEIALEVDVVVPVLNVCRGHDKRSEQERERPAMVARVGAEAKSRDNEWICLAKFALKVGDVT